MPQMFPLIDVLGQAWHGIFWGFRAAMRNRPEQGAPQKSGSSRLAKAQAGQQP